MSARRRWTDLSPDLLAVISGLLHDAADYVRFHAVCKPWRESLPSSAAQRPFFFPWLFAPPSSRCSSWDLDRKLRCVFSKTSYLAEVPGRLYGHSWITRADGTGFLFFSASPEPTLVDPLTGDATSLPPFVHGDGKNNCPVMENSRGVVYGDGTIFFYNFSHWVLDKDENYYEKPGEGDDETSISFQAAILRPGDTAWKFVHRWFDFGMYTWEEEFLIRRFFAAYRVDNGNILVHLDRDNHYVDKWHLLTPLAGDHTSVKGEDHYCEMTMEESVESSHILESRGELLRVSVLIQCRLGQPMAYEVSAPLAVSVHALEEQVDAHGRHMVRWVRRDGQSFADRVMFLGFPTSFAMEASRFRGGVDDVSGGWVYFLQPRSEVYGLSLPGVFRYNLIDGKAKFMERVPLDDLFDHENEAFMWQMPQPTITPIQVIREKLESPETGDSSLKINITRMERPSTHSKEHFLSFNVQNLPLGVDSSRLHRFFNKHGKVSNAEVTSLGKGSVTMAMETSTKPFEARDALDGLVLDGYTLEVSEAMVATEESRVTSSCSNLATI